MNPGCFEGADSEFSRVHPWLEIRGSLAARGPRNDGAGPMKALAEQIHDIDGLEIYVRVMGVGGLMVEVAGPHPRHVGGCTVDH
jgi:hypothetical protein